MAGPQFAGLVHLHIEIAALNEPRWDFVPSGRRSGPPHRGHSADHGAKHDHRNSPRDGTPASHVVLVSFSWRSYLARVYSFAVGSLSATCSPALTPLATIILSPLFLPTSMDRSSKFVPRHT